MKLAISSTRDMRYLAMALLAAVLVTACSQGTEDIEMWIAEVRERAAPPLDPLPVIRQYESVEYSAQSMRDPFSAPANLNEAGGGPDADRRKELLEAFPLDSLDMVGTIGEGNSLVGLVLAPDEVVYRVKFGNYLGQSEGRITGIYEDRIELVELVSDGAGGWLERQAGLALEDTPVGSDK